MKYKNNFKLKINNVVISSAIFMIYAIITLIVFFTAEKHYCIDFVKETLSAVSNSKALLVKNWYTDEVTDCRVISEDQNLRDMLQLYKKSGSDYYLLVRTLNQIKIEHEYSDVIILSMDGKYIASTNAGLAFDDPSEIENFRNATIINNLYVSDIYRSTIDNEQYIDFISIIKDYDDLDIACIIFKKNPKPFFNEIITNWPYMHETVRTFLVKINDKSQLVKYNNSIENKESWIQYQSIDTNRKKVKSLNSGFLINGVSDGKVVFSNTVLIPETPWGIVVEVDKNEMISSLYSDLKNAIGIMCIISILFFIVFFFFFNYKRKKINKDESDSDSSLTLFKEEFNLILDILEECIIVSDVSGSIRYMNLKAESLTGWKLSEVLEKNIDYVFRIRNIETGFSAFNYQNWVSVETGMTTINDVELIDKDEQPIPVSCSITPMKQGINNQNGVIVSIHDVRDKFLYEKIIMESERRFKYYFHDSPDASIIVDCKGEIRLANRQALLKYSYTMIELTGMKMTRLVPIELYEFQNMLDHYFENPLKLSMGLSKKIYGLKKDGSRFPILMTINPIMLDNQNMAIVVIRDISAELKNEETHFL
jgi:PAS domain S-box-containing protein